MAHTPPETPEQVTVGCPSCRARLRARVTKTGKKIACPQCGAEIQLPPRAADKPGAADRKSGRRPSSVPIAAADSGGASGPAESEAVQAAPPGRDDQYRLLLPDGEDNADADAGRSPYRLVIPTEPSSTVLPNYLDAQAEVKGEPPAPPPKWAFFSGVFDFPWQREVLVRWIFLSVGLTACSAIGLLIVSLYGGAGGAVGLVLAFFVLPIIWIAVWTFSYAAALCVCIIEDTSAGNRKVVNWPEPVWKEWAAQLIYLGYLAMLTAVAVYGVARVVELAGGPFWPAWCAGFFVLYPVCLMSSLEANSPWVPLTRPILNTFASLWWGWLLFYALTAALLAGWWGLTAAAFALHIGLAILLSGPTLAAVVLIYARLLGRLAWRANQPS